MNLAFITQKIYVQLINRDSNCSGDQIPLEPLIPISYVNTDSPSNFLQLACGFPGFSLNTFVKTFLYFWRDTVFTCALKWVRQMKQREKES